MPRELAPDLAALTAAQAERARLWQAEELGKAPELRKARELKHTLKPRGPRLEM